MAEMVLVNLLMNGDADRDERNDWTEMGLSLPFIEEVSAGLGIAVKTYLDELSNEVEPTNEEAKNRQKEKLPRMFAQAVDIVGDVKLAFRVWDAVSTLELFDDGLQLFYLLDLLMRWAFRWSLALKFCRKKACW